MSDPRSERTGSNVSGPAGKPEVEPWPKWVGYLLFAALVAILIFGAIRLADHGASGAVIRVVLVVVIVTAVLAPLQFLGVRRRVGRVAGGLTERLDQVAPKIEQELATEARQRATLAADDDLRAAVATVSAALHQLRDGEQAQAADSVQQLGRMVGESWDQSAPVSRGIAECAKNAHTLDVLLRRVQRSTR